MSKKVSIGLILALLLTLMATAVQAQARGSIRGSVREDTNGDGKCTDGAAIVGMTIEFKSTHAEMVTVYLQSGDDGTYGLVAAGLGNWEVTAMPNSDYRITSKKTIPVFIDETQNLALGYRLLCSEDLWDQRWRQHRPAPIWWCRPNPKPSSGPLPGSSARRHALRDGRRPGISPSPGPVNLFPIIMALFVIGV